jgi:hypothetical protein
VVTELLLGLADDLIDDEIPWNVRAFLRACIPSVGHMEALVLLMEEPNQVWRGGTVAQRLYVPEPFAGSLLKHLSAVGLVGCAVSTEEWTFAPEDPALADEAWQALRMYRERLLPMTRLIQSREDAATQFANAFRIRKA